MFDTALLESRAIPVARGKAVSLPIALGVHAAVIAAFVGAAVWNVGEPAEPADPVVFPLFGRVAQLPQGDGGQNHLSETRTRTRPTTASPNVAALPSNSRQQELPTGEGPEHRGAETAGPVGDPTREPDGTGDSAVIGIGDREDGPIPVSGEVKAPVLLSRVEPEYPEAARRAHLEGIVVLEAVITESGVVEELRVLKSANPLLDRAAAESVRRWRYSAATLRGRAVSVYLTVTVTFGLRS